MMKHQQEMQRLDFYEEAVGVLTELTGDKGCLIARISKVVLGLPPEMENRMRPLIGKRVGILRTDIPQKEYLVRSIPDKMFQVSDEVAPIDPTLWNVLRGPHAKGARA